MRDDDPEPATAGNAGQRDLCTGKAEQSWQLFEVARGDQEEIATHLISVRQRQVELDLVGSWLAMLGDDTGEHLVAHALARLVEPAIEVHRSEHQPRDYHREPQPG